MLAPNQRSVENEASFGFPLFHEGPLNTAGALPTGGSVRAVVIAVDFPDAPATQDATQLANTTVSGLGRFEEYSYGRFSVSAQIVPGWRRMSRPASSYASLSDGGDGARVFLSEATGMVDAEVDFSTVEFVFVIAPGLAPHQRAGNPAWSVFPGRGFTRDGNEILHATTMMRAFTLEHQDIASTANHELAHSLGLPEAYEQTPAGTRFDLVGMWDLMSQPNQHHFLAWHKYRLGWIDQGQITCIDSPREAGVTLTPLETPGGTKAVVVRTTPSQAYVVEARRKLGLDANLCRDGVLVYTVDSQVDNGGGPIRVQRGAEDVPGPERDRCDTLYNAPFQPVQTFEDAYVRVRVVASTGLDYTVEVARKS
jgi:M6 family metalloprotease-like protein